MKRWHAAQMVACLAAACLPFSQAGPRAPVPSVSESVPNVWPTTDQYPIGTVITVVGTGTRGFSGDGGRAANAQLASPEEISFDETGNLLIADVDNNRIRRVQSNGMIETIAGVGPNMTRTSYGENFGGDGGPATEAKLSVPATVAVDTIGSLLICDTGNYRVRRIDRDGRMTTIAGVGYRSIPSDLLADAVNEGGLAVNAYLLIPSGLAVGPLGDIFVSVIGSNRVRKIDTSGIITTVAGSGALYSSEGGYYCGDGGPATSGCLNGPLGLAVDKFRRLFIADSGNDRIRMVDTLGGISTVAGIGGKEIGLIGHATFSGDGGRAIDAELRWPTALAFDHEGSLYFCDTGNNRVRKIDTNGIISTVAGSGPEFPPGEGSFAGDGGEATKAKFNSPMGLAFDRTGNLFISDTKNNRIRMVILAR